MRRVTVATTIDGVDDETFGSNEYGHAEFTRETILADGSPQNMMEMECRWGGECRVELRLTGQLQDHGRVLVTGEALLFEGTSRTTNDLDGRTDFTVLVPRGRTVSDTQYLANANQGGDTATVRLTISNNLVEEAQEEE